MEIETPTAYRKRLELFLTQPDVLDEICAFISNGGTVVDLCELRELRFGDVMNWIHKDPVREERYRVAMNDRDEWYRDALMAELRRIATTDIRKAEGKAIGQIDSDTAKAISGITYGDDGNIKSIKFYDKLKAIEMAGRQIGMFRDKVDKLNDSLEALVAGSWDKAKPGEGTSV